MPSSPAATGREILPIVRDPGLFRTEAEVRLSQPVDLHPGADARGARRSGLRVQRRPDPQPGDPDQPAGHVLELPGHPVAAGRDGAGAARRPADAEPVRPAALACLAALRAGPDGLHRLRQHLSLALSLGRLFRRLLGSPGRSRRPQQGAGRAGSRSQVHLGKSVYRVGDQVSVGVRYTDPAALAEAAELAAELEIAGQPPEPLRFEKVARRSRPLDGQLPGRTGRVRIRSGSCPATAATAAPTSASRPPRSASSRPARDRRAVAQPAALTELARLTSGRVFELADVERARRGHPDARSDANARNARRALGRPPLLHDDRARPDPRMGAAEDVSDGLESVRL